MKFHVLILFLISGSINAQDIAVYQLQNFEKAKGVSIAFVSLSDSYTLNEHPDTSAVPDVSAMNPMAARYFRLENVYRERFLTGVNLSEKDSVFINDYAKGKLHAIAVHEVPVLAVLNQYADEDEYPYTQEDYMIGFEVPPGKLQGLSENYANTFVATGKENPFAQGKLQPLQWKVITPAEFPIIVFKDSASTRDMKMGNAYQAENESFRFYIQEYLKNDELFARRLLVFNASEKEPLRKAFYFNTESTGHAPLNNVNSENDPGMYQWTGNLFKNKPPVLFGFLFHTFGCPEISFLHKRERDLYIRCDNRH